MQSTYRSRLSALGAALALAFGLVHIASLALQAEGPADSFLVMLLAASALPYVACAAVARFTRWLAAALGGLALIAGFDVWMYWSVFIAPKSSTAAIGLIFAPLWKLFVALPVGALLGYAVDAVFSKRLSK